MEKLTEVPSNSKMTAGKKDNEIIGQGDNICRLQTSRIAGEENKR